MSKKQISLDEIEIKSSRENKFGISKLNNIEGTTIFAGKKSEAVYVQDLNANLASNNSRQVFSKVAGINVFENDGSGITISIGGRGLNPNRISNFNTRQNGYDISADALGYPESYYTPPTEAIERIEILRGAAGLQFGTQFGGLINYKFAEAPKDKKIATNLSQTGGSYSFLNSFNQIYGHVSKIDYNTFYLYKNYGGWRKNSNLISHNAFASVRFNINDNLSIKGEYTHLQYLAKQAGGLTDKQFYKDASYTNRNRNWFKVNWNLMSISSDYKVNDFAKVSFCGFGLLAGRDALGFLGRPDRSDDTSLNRNLLSDTYKNFGAEVKYLQRYILNDYNSHFLIGARVYQGLTDRKQGDADKSDQANFKFLNPDLLENSHYLFPSSNFALFAENIFQFNRNWSVTPGLRYEKINTSANGYYRLIYKDLAGSVLLDAKVKEEKQNIRDFILAGIGTQYKTGCCIELYANFSQNYRSINFNDMRVLNPNFAVDPNLKDERGFTTDAGMRGSYKDLIYFDLSFYFLKYNNRIGTIIKTDSNTYNLIRYRTNVSDSRNVGAEAFCELDWIKLVNKSAKHKLSTFVNLAFTDARYINSKESAYRNKIVEYVPSIIFRTGIAYGWKGFHLNLQYSYTSDQYSDATNAESSVSGIYGTIPAYSVVDISSGYKFKKFSVSTGINNALNSLYFTRRAEGYPGPGIIPADPINYYLNLKLHF
ncbi:MAG: TonB-dependent receptor [Sphingobacteriaceae bacterium]|nr:TonB-dependent receptor [Sphingobacteriaceae bacterium]